VDQFRFREDVEGPDRSKYLWGNAAFAFGEVVIRAFAETGWLAGIRGVDRGIEGGGLVTRLPVHYFSTDKTGVVPKCSTDLIVTDALEKPLADLGFIPLCHCYDTEYSAFYSSQSIQKPRKYDRPQATRNARISAMFQSMLCASRFAHYLKVIARDKVGSFAEPSDFERDLQSWLSGYVTSDEHASREVKSRFPLREGTVEVRRHPGRPGAYHCIMRLWPHFELDELTASVHLATALAPRRSD
jgi:type VI secretion system ImpC/EvpB family protein